MTSLTYGRSFEGLFTKLARTARQEFNKRLGTLPVQVRAYAGTFKRDGSLEGLRRRLAAELPLV